LVVFVSGLKSLFFLRGRDGYGNDSCKASWYYFCHGLPPNCHGKTLTVSIRLLAAAEKEEQQKKLHILRTKNQTSLKQQQQRMIVAAAAANNATNASMSAP
jgi:hypothetical protein